MKKLCLLLSAIVCVSGCDAQNSSTAMATITTTVTENKDVHHVILTQTDAEKILGEPAHITESSNEGTTIYKSTYTANNADAPSGKTGNIYFMYEVHPDDAAAHKVYADIKTANEKNGIKTLTGLGDEAYFHTDNTNFLFIMARKGTKMIRMKVNKTTSHTSADGFNEVAKDIVAKL
jgi:hypothetical protein